MSQSANPDNGAGVSPTNYWNYTACNFYSLTLTNTNYYSFQWSGATQPLSAILIGPVNTANPLTTQLGGALVANTEITSGTFLGGYNPNNGLGYSPTTAGTYLLVIAQYHQYNNGPTNYTLTLSTGAVTPTITPLTMPSNGGVGESGTVGPTTYANNAGTVGNNSYWWGSNTNNWGVTNGLSDNAGFVAGTWVANANPPMPSTYSPLNGGTGWQYTACNFYSMTLYAGYSYTFAWSGATSNLCGILIGPVANPTTDSVTTQLGSTLVAWSALSSSTELAGSASSNVSYTVPGSGGASAGTYILVIGGWNQYNNPTNYSLTITASIGAATVSLPTANTVTVDNGTYSFPVTFSHAPGATVTVPITLSGTAVYGASADYTLNYTPSSNVISPTVANTSSTAMITVTFLTNPGATPKTITFTMGTPTPATYATPGSPTVYTLTMAQPPAGNPVNPIIVSSFPYTDSSRNLVAVGFSSGQYNTVTGSSLSTPVSATTFANNYSANVGGWTGPGGMYQCVYQVTLAANTLYTISETSVGGSGIPFVIVYNQFGTQQLAYHESGTVYMNGGPSGGTYWIVCSEWTNAPLTHTLTVTAGTTGAAPAISLVPALGVNNSGTISYFGVMVVNPTTGLLYPAAGTIAGPVATPATINSWSELGGTTTTSYTTGGMNVTNGIATGNSGSANNSAGQTTPTNWNVRMIYVGNEGTYWVTASAGVEPASPAVTVPSFTTFSGPASIQYGTTPSYTALVSSSATGYVAITAKNTSTGTVYGGNTAINLINAGSSNTLSGPANLPIGSYTVTASYFANSPSTAANTTFANSTNGTYVTATLALTVTADPPTLAFTNPVGTSASSPATGVYGSNFTVAATSNSAGAITYAIAVNDGSSAVGHVTTSTNPATTVNSSSGVLTLGGVGTVVVSATQAANGIYAAATVYAYFNVTQAGPLTITPTNTTANLSMTYGSFFPVIAYAASGTFFNGDSGTSITFSGALGTTTAITSTSSAGSYPISLGTLATPNYTLVLAPTNFTVNQAPLTITAGNASHVYGTAFPTGPGSTAFTSSALQNGETIGTVTITGTSSPDNGTLATSPVGSYILTPSAATGGTFTPTNYNITYVNGTLSVSKYQLTVTPNSNLTMTYGGTPSGTVPTPGYTVTGYQDSDNITNTPVTGSLAALVGTGPTAVTTSSPVGGTYSVGGLSNLVIGGANAGDYSLALAPTAFTVTPAPLTITASNASHVFGTTFATGAGSTAFTSIGLQNSETIGSVTITATSTPDDGTTATSPAGSYIITPSAATGGTFNTGNYGIAYINGTLTVSQAPQTITVSTPGTPVELGQVVALSATGGLSGSPVTFSIDASSTGAGTITGSNLKATAAGTIVINYNQAGNTNYSQAPQVQQSLTALAPGITSISPMSGPLTGSTTVTITGVNLANATAVYFGGNAATGVVVNSDSSITAVTPAGSAGPVNVVVKVGNSGSSYTSSDQFTYVLYFTYNWTTWSSLNWSTPTGSSIAWNSQTIPVAFSVNNSFFSWFAPATLPYAVTPANGALSGISWGTPISTNIAASGGMDGPFAGSDPAGNGGSIVTGDWKDFATGQLSYYGTYSNGTAWNNPVFWSYYNTLVSGGQLPSTYSIMATTTTVTTSSGYQYFLAADGQASSSLGRTSYVGNSGMYYFDNDPSHTANAKYSNGPLFQDSKTKLTDITDGSSNTLLFGESLGGPDNALPTYQLTWMGTGTMPSYWDCQTPSQYFMFSSMHPGVVNFAFCDGSVRSVTKVTASVPPDSMGTYGGTTLGDGTNNVQDSVNPPAASNPPTPRWIAFQLLAGINDNASPDLAQLGLTP
jgi:prepilin-type processing-associated H-X9-DG protein